MGVMMAANAKIARIDPVHLMRQQGYVRPPWK